MKGCEDLSRTGLDDSPCLDWIKTIIDYSSGNSHDEYSSRGNSITMPTPQSSLTTEIRGGEREGGRGGCGRRVVWGRELEIRMGYGATRPECSSPNTLNNQ